MSTDAGRDEPFISVVIASVNGQPCIAECLDHLTRQNGQTRDEVLVMDRCDRATIERVEPEHDENVWEAFLHRRLKEQGVQFFCPEGLWVEHRKNFGFWYFMSQRYDDSRSYAGMRLRTSPRWKRAGEAVGAVFGPGESLARVE